MEWERIEAAWPDYGKRAQRRWDRLSPQDVAAAAGNRSRLLEGIVQRYGVTASEAERQLAQWQSQQVAVAAGADSASVREDVEETGRGYCDDETEREAPGDGIRRSEPHEPLPPLDPNPPVRGGTCDS